ncbi:unnamed protein product [Bemisia tabaci]|uniref:Uncharacterized protein n=1 Tax=Bemisia tabaci TaxID=7038 RepID=A0A9P0AGH4_BEMTA|nr:unnamed protein product [Bemisia tabaci]
MTEFFNNQLRTTAFEAPAGTDLTPSADIPPGDLAKKPKVSSATVKAYTWLHRNDSCVANTARGIAKAVVAESLLSTFSLQGGRAKNKPHKRPFNALALYSLIIRVVRAVWKSRCTDYEEQVEKTLKQFLIDCNPTHAEKTE